MIPTTMLCSCRDADGRTARSSGSEVRPVWAPASMWRAPALPLARAPEQALTGCASTRRMRSDRRSVSYQRMSVPPVFPASRPASCRSSSDRPGKHGDASILNGGVSRSFVSTVCLRAMDIDSRHFADDVNRLSANAESTCARWITEQRGTSRIAAVELADDATRLSAQVAQSKGHGWRRCAAGLGAVHRSSPGRATTRTGPSVSVAVAGSGAGRRPEAGSSMAAQEPEHGAAAGADSGEHDGEGDEGDPLALRRSERTFLAGSR